MKFATSLPSTEFTDQPTTFELSDYPGLVGVAAIIEKFALYGAATEPNLLHNIGQPNSLSVPEGLIEMLQVLGSPEVGSGAVYTERHLVLDMFGIECMVSTEVAAEHITTELPSLYMDEMVLHTGMATEPEQRLTRYVMAVDGSVPGGPLLNVQVLGAYGIVFSRESSDADMVVLDSPAALPVVEATLSTHTNPLDPEAYIEHFADPAQAMQPMLEAVAAYRRLADATNLDAYLAFEAFGS